jgi:FkbM family methyltransferase
MTLAQFLLRIRPIELAELLKKVLGVSYGEFKVGNLTLWLDPASDYGSRVLEEGSYEAAFTSALLGMLKPGDCFVDLGANEGWFSLVASGAVGPSGRVYAIEPQQRLWPVILQNFSLNDRNNCQLIPHAIGQAEGFIDLILYPSLNTGASTAVAAARRRFFKRQKSRMLTMTSIIQRYSITKIDVLKIDIEGYELNALRGMGPKLSDGSISTIFIELHPAQLKELGQSVEDVVWLLKDSGYRCNDGNNTIWTR